MPRYQVPQFIEQKAKIIGPLTLRQFFFVGGAGGVSIISFYVFNTFIWFVVSILAFGIGLGLAFVEIQGQKLPELIVAALQYWQKPSEYVWKRETPTTTLDVSSLEKIKAMRRNMSLQQKIKSAALSIATGSTSLFSGKGDKQGRPKDEYQVVTHATGERSVAKKVDYTQD